MKKLLSFLPIILITLTGCEDVDYGVNDTRSFTEFKVSVENDATTRLYLENGNQLKWNNGDGIGVFSDEQDVEHYSLSSVGETSVFYGNKIQGNKFFAFYPYSEETLDTSDRYILHYNYSPSYICGDEGRFPIETFMVAKSDNNNLSFMLTMGFIHISLTGTCQLNKSIMLSGNNNEILGGEGFVDLTQDEPILMLKDNNEAIHSSYIWFQNDSIRLNEDEPYDFYFPVPVGTYEKGITITIRAIEPNTDKEIILEKRTTDPVIIKRAVIIHFSAVDADKVLKEEKEISIKERTALMDLYNSTGGDNWIEKENWGSDKPLREWYGVTTDERGRVTYITLSQNNLSGYIPVSISDLRNLIHLDLSINQLSGEIPESIGNLTKLTHLILGANELTGSVPKTIANIKNLKLLDVSQNKMNGTIPAEITNASWWNISTIAKGQQEGYFLKYELIYESTDFSQDGKVITLQTHTVGNGVPLVILGDAFSDRMIADNTFSNLANEVMEAFFELEPYITFRGYFDVYAVVAVSLNEITGENTAYKIDYFNNIPIEGRDRINSDVLRIPSLNGSLDNVTCAIFYNEAPKGVGLVSWYSFIDASGNGFNFGECSVRDDGHINKYLVHHEVAGHCFGGLADERVNDYAPNVYPESDYENLDLWHSEGYNYNIDYHNTKETSFWKDFFANPEYEVEKLDLYEGALYSFGKGIYRPSFSSIMNQYDENYYYYNAPSRLAIYKRIMELSGEGYSFESFLEYDKKNLEAIKNGAITRNYVERHNSDISIQSPCVISIK